MKRVLLLLVLLVAVVLAWQWFDVGEWLSFAQLKARQQALSALVEAHPWRAAATFFALYVVVTALSIPGAGILSLSAGALFGLARGTPLTLFAATLGATLAFLLTRYLLAAWVRERFGRRLRGIDAGIERDGSYYLFGLRLVPIFPFFLINLAMGLTHMPVGRFAVVSLLGMLPASLAFVNAGTQLASIESPGEVLSPRVLLAFAILGVLPLLLRWLWRWVEARRALRGFKKPAQFDANVMVIGAGAGGLVASYIVNTLGGKALLVERAQMGGDCLNTGCVPSKALIGAAQSVATARRSAALGIELNLGAVDFPKMMRHVQGAIARIAPHDSTARYRDLGVDVRHGNARIESPWTVSVDGQRVNAKAIVIASGAQPFLPPIPGLDQIDCLTSDNLWALAELPERLAVIGGGAIGCELAQAFARLGSQVTVVEALPGILGRSEPEAAGLVAEALRADGVRLLTDCKVTEIAGNGAPGTLVCEREGAQLKVPFDRLLVAVGRQPVTDGLGLDALGLRCTERGAIEVDSAMRTNIPNIFAVGDVTGTYPFTHMAGYQGSVAGVNALLGAWGRRKADYRAVPAVVFTDPELAQVGATSAQLQADETPFERTRFELAKLDRAVAEARSDGFVQALTDPKGRVLGVTVVGAHGGEQIDVFTRLIQSGGKLADLQQAIVAYPTWADAANRTAGLWRQQHAPATALRWARRWFRRGLS